MNIFEFKDYRLFLKKKIYSLPKKGRGEINRIAKAAGVHPSLISQILMSEKNLSLEQAQLISEHFDLTNQENEYFLLLVQFQRAGTQKLQTYFEKKLTSLRITSIEISERVRQDRQLTEEEKSVIYSHWIYLSVWLYSSIGSGKTLYDVSQRFELTRERANEILSFLVHTRLCILENEIFKMGSQSIHISRESPHLYRHHTNWRLRAVEASDKISADELMYTAPMSISKSDFKKLRARLIEIIKEVTDMAIDSAAEEMVYFGLDFFWIKK